MTMAILLGGILLWGGLAMLLHTGITRRQSRRPAPFYIIYDLAEVAEEAERWLRSQKDQTD